MKLKAHLKLAKLVKRLQKKVTENAAKKVSLANDVMGIILDIKSILDEDYHSLITNAQFREFGHIYYCITKGEAEKELEAKDGTNTQTDNKIR